MHGRAGAPPGHTRHHQHAGVPLPPARINDMRREYARTTDGVASPSVPQSRCRTRQRQARHRFAHHTHPTGCAAQTPGSGGGRLKPIGALHADDLALGRTGRVGAALDAREVAHVRLARHRRRERALLCNTTQLSLRRLLKQTKATRREQTEGADPKIRAEWVSEPGTFRCSGTRPVERWRYSSPVESQGKAPS